MVMLSVSKIKNKVFCCCCCSCDQIIEEHKQFLTNRAEYLNIIYELWNLILLFSFLYVSNNIHKGMEIISWIEIKHIGKQKIVAYLITNTNREKKII